MFSALFFFPISILCFVCSCTDFSFDNSHTIQAHTNRINSINFFKISSQYYISSASNDGKFKVWNTTNNTITLKSEREFTGCKVLNKNSGQQGGSIGQYLSVQGAGVIEFSLFNLTTRRILAESTIAFTYVSYVYAELAISTYSLSASSPPQINFYDYRLNTSYRNIPLPLSNTDKAKKILSLLGSYLGVLNEDSTNSHLFLLDCTNNNFGIIQTLYHSGHQIVDFANIQNYINSIHSNHLLYVLDNGDIYGYTLNFSGAFFSFMFNYNISGKVPVAIFGGEQNSYSFGVVYTDTVVFFTVGNNTPQKTITTSHPNITAVYLIEGILSTGDNSGNITFWTRVAGNYSNTSSGSNSSGSGSSGSSTIHSNSNSNSTSSKSNTSSVDLRVALGVGLGVACIVGIGIVFTLWFFKIKKTAQQTTQLADSSTVFVKNLSRQPEQSQTITKQQYINQKGDNIIIIQPIKNYEGIQVYQLGRNRFDTF